ncbi:MAG TPA: response regulator [bacterium]|nr:response regulator [bacterium]
MAGSKRYKFSILIVDDDLAYRSAVQTCFPTGEYHVATATDGEAALALIEKSRFDLVITDLQMPRMDGHSLIQVLRNRYPALPIIVMTAGPEPDTSHPQSWNPPLNCLVKPFRKDTLLAMTRKLLPAGGFHEWNPNASPRPVH